MPLSVKFKKQECLVVKEYIREEDIRPELHYYELFTEAKWDDEPFSIVDTKIPYKGSDLKYTYYWGVIITKKPLNLEGKLETILTEQDIDAIRFNENAKSFESIEEWLNKQEG